MFVLKSGKWTPIIHCYETFLSQLKHFIYIIPKED